MKASAGGEPDAGTSERPGSSEVELVERIGVDVSKNVRTALAGDIRDAIVRERQVVEDKIVQSVSLVSEDVQVQMQAMSDTVKSLSDTVKSNSVSSASAASAASIAATAATAVKALEESSTALSGASMSLASDVASLTKRVADLEADIDSKKTKVELLSARIVTLEEAVASYAASPEAAA